MMIKNEAHRFKTLCAIFSNEESLKVINLLMSMEKPISVTDIEIKTRLRQSIASYILKRLRDHKLAYYSTYGKTHMYWINKDAVRLFYSSIHNFFNH